MFMFVYACVTSEDRALKQLYQQGLIGPFKVLLDWLRGQPQTLKVGGR